MTCRQAAQIRRQGLEAVGGAEGIGTEEVGGPASPAHSGCTRCTGVPGKMGASRST